MIAYIDPRYVLTAAHCLVLQSPHKLSSVVVVVGEHDRQDPSDGEEKIKVAQVINHPYYIIHPDYENSDFGKEGKLLVTTALVKLKTVLEWKRTEI